MGVESVMIQVQQSEIICLPAMGNVLWWDLSHHRQGSLHHWPPSHGCGVCNYTSSTIRNNLGLFFGGTCHTIGRVVYITGRLHMSVESVIIQVQQSEIICLPGSRNVLWWDLSHQRQGSLHHWPPSHEF